MSAPGRRPRVLVIEDERGLAEVLADNLREEGHEIVLAHDGGEGLARWREGGFDLVVLDVMLPHVDGLEVCRIRREEGDETPVLFLSAKGRPEERVQGLAAGGDDYLAKPFHLPEFLLRVEAVLRRRGWGEGRRAIRFAGHEVDLRAWTATLADGRQETLGEREIGILRLLASRPGEVVSRDDILDEVWGSDAFPSSRTVDNVVMRLRKTLEPDPARPVHFHTVWGVGYRFTPEEES
ncbi:MAG: response regulator transcription factor [Trueperaceae bacterium]|nr:response regulator transcription factor [Trueperaceae bacterium]